jgi:hypothetical protein
LRKEALADANRSKRKDLGMNVPADRTRCATVWLLATAWGLAVAAWLLPDVARAARVVASGDLRGRPFEELLVWCCSAAAVAAACWLWAVTSLVALEAARGHTSPSRRGVPASVRRVVLAACGVALAGSASSPALATPGQVHQDRAGPATVSLVSGLPLPDRATGAAPRARAAVTPAPSHGGTVVVQRGDTLWSLAQQDLPPGATPAAVGRRWQQIYEENRVVIGVDPDVIHPGQQLRLPRD